MSSLTEFLAATDYASLFNTYANDTKIATNSTLNLVQRLTSWIEAGIIEPPQLDEYSKEIPFTTKFAEGKAVYMRHWSNKRLDSKIDFDVGYTSIKMSTGDKITPMGVNNGWSLGVYKYSTNLDASVKMIKYLSSQEFQRQSILQSSTPIQPTYPSLLDSKLILIFINSKMN